MTETHLPWAPALYHTCSMYTVQYTCSTYFDYVVANTSSRFEPSHSQRERLRFVESTLLWEGEIQRSRVSTVFGVVLNHVTKDFREYEAAFPQSLRFEPRRRFYIPGPAFKPRFASEDPHEYLALQLASSQTRSSAVIPLVGGLLPIQGLPTPAHGVTRQVLSIVVQAIRSATAAEVIYHSMTATETTKRRIWPHALIHTGAWWHVRALDGRSGEFRNFALQRIEQAKSIGEPSSQPRENDANWHTESVLEVVPHPGLNDHQKRVVAKEFGMTVDGGEPVWRVRVRNCLIGYFAAHYGLDLPDARPPRYVLSLRDKEDVKRSFLPPNAD